MVHSTATRNLKTECRCANDDNDGRDDEDDSDATYDEYEDGDDDDNDDGDFLQYPGIQQHRQITIGSELENALTVG